MAFVPPDNLHRLIRQYYRLHGKPYPKNETEKFRLVWHAQEKTKGMGRNILYSIHLLVLLICSININSARSFLFVKYGCDPGYEMVDEADTVWLFHPSIHPFIHASSPIKMFCRDRVWVQTPPICRGKGLCERDNGGCTHSCISFAQNGTVECRCPKGLVLDMDGKTCIKPVPKSLCRKVSEREGMAVQCTVYMHNTALYTMHYITLHIHSSWPGAPARRWMIAN
jgi:hypothetical protein